MQTLLAVSLVLSTSQLMTEPLTLNCQLSQTCVPVGGILCTDEVQAPFRFVQSDSEAAELHFTNITRYQKTLEVSDAGTVNSTHSNDRASVVFASGADHHPHMLTFVVSYDEGIPAVLIAACDLAVEPDQ